jgi:hypothetical protein
MVNDASTESKFSAARLNSQKMNLKTETDITYKLIFVHALSAKCLARVPVGIKAEKTVTTIQMAVESLDAIGEPIKNVSIPERMLIKEMGTRAKFQRARWNFPIALA